MKRKLLITVMLLALTVSSAGYAFAGTAPEDAALKPYLTDIYKLLAQLPIFHQQQKIFLVNMELDIEPLWESVKLRILLPLLCLKKQEIFLSLIEDN